MSSQRYQFCPLRHCHVIKIDHKMGWGLKQKKKVEICIATMIFKIRKLKIHSNEFFVLSILCKHN